MHATVVDLFCGVGGLSYGFKTEGFAVKAGIDSDPSCEYAFETNVGAPFIAKDIKRLSAAQVARAFGGTQAGYRVLIGCAPCAPFSIYTGRYRKARRRDHHRKWELLKEFTRLALATKPDIVSMENVPRLQRHPIFKRFVASLRENGYVVSHYKVRADRYGVPQRRSRLVLFASRFGEIKMLPPTHERPVTVREAIGQLPRIKAGTAHRNDRLHMSRALSETNLRRLRATGPGGSWKDWSPEMQLACHKKRKGKSFRSVYGRMRWNEAAPVITTQCLGIGNGRFGHPEQNRAISVREAALLQTFPLKFRFVAPTKPVIGIHLARQIGNAVPVRLGRIIARSIKRHLQAVDAAL
jgi:DNA (cytosine-5)-methyltransferase 1